MLNKLNIYGWLYKISKNLTFNGRIENLFDENYEEVSSYGREGRSFYGGVNMEF